MKKLVLNVGCLADEDFMETESYVMKDHKIYRRATNGLIECSLRTTRNVGKYKVCAMHSNGALPLTKYYIIDTKEQVIYESVEYMSSVLKEIVNGLKKLSEKDS